MMQEFVVASGKCDANMFATRLGSCRNSRCFPGCILALMTFAKWERSLSLSNAA